MDWWHQLIGFDEPKLTLYQMLIRGTIIFFIALAYVRIAGVRTLGKIAIFDQITILILGSILGRAIVTNQPFIPTLLVVLLLMLLHRLMAWISFRSHKAGSIIKGEPLLLVKDGQVQWDNMRKSHIAIHDLQEMLRIEGHHPQIEKIKECYLERSGKISIVE